MNRLTRTMIRDIMAQVLNARDKILPSDDGISLRDIGFQSLDFSELVLRVEDEIGVELNFTAGGLRRITTVGDVLDFVDELQRT